MFHLPNSLKKHRMSFMPSTKQWQDDSKGDKAQNILGINSVDIDAARSQSISSTATTKLPSFSDATTELGSQAYQKGYLDLPELQLKASSTLLREEYLQDADGADPTKSPRLKTYDSNSTLHSHYDAAKAPPSISQQTSDSSRRDFALRKGAPIVVTSTTPEKDLRTQLKFFKSSRSSPKPESKKLTKSGPAPYEKFNQASDSQLSVTESDSAFVPVPRVPSSTAGSKKPSQQQKGVRFLPDHRILASVHDKRPAKKVHLDLVSQQPKLKVNVQQPKVGVQHWFDSLEDESSEEESIHEPELHPTFVNGLESAFLEGRIGLSSTDEFTTTSDTIQPRDVNASFISNSSRYSASLSPTEQAPRTVALSAKASNSSLSKSQPQPRQAKRKHRPLAEIDLNQNSFLSLSSDEEEDDFLTPERGRSVSRPVIRESLVRDSIASADVEVGTAKAIAAKRALNPLSVPRLTVDSYVENRRQSKSPRAVPQRLSSRSMTYLSDSSSIRPVGESDLLTSFPPTPADSQRGSLQTFDCLSDSASIESKRLMSVTKQEESLLAAMRLKKAAMKNGSSSDKRIDALKCLEGRFPNSRPHSDASLYHSEATSYLNLASASQPNFQNPVSSRQRSMSGDEGTRPRLSDTTFQTGSSADQGNRSSKVTFTTEISNEPKSRLSLSSSLYSQASPSLLWGHNVDNRASKGTYFSTSTNDYHGQSRNVTGSSHVVTLDGLQPPGRRDDIRSQEFITWPYNGWEHQAELAMAH